MSGKSMTPEEAAKIRDTWTVEDWRKNAARLDENIIFLITVIRKLPPEERLSRLRKVRSAIPEREVPFLEMICLLSNEAIDRLLASRTKTSA